MSHFSHIPGIYNPPISHYSELPVPTYVNVGLLVGKNGKHFKKITSDSKCTYIWYDKKRNFIEIWGPMWALTNATDILLERFNKFKPDLGIEDLEEILTVTSTYNRPNGNTVYEIEGLDWVVYDYCIKKFKTDCHHIEECHKLDDKFWFKVVVY